MKIKRITDENGVWEVFGDGSRALIEPSQKWLDNQKQPEITQSNKPAASAPDEITAEEALAILLGGEDA